MQNKNGGQPLNAKKSPAFVLFCTTGELLAFRFSASERSMTFVTKSCRWQSLSPTSSFIFPASRCIGKLALHAVLYKSTENFPKVTQESDNCIAHFRQTKQVKTCGIKDLKTSFLIQSWKTTRSRSRALQLLTIDNLENVTQSCANLEIYINDFFKSWRSCLQCWEGESY